MDNRNVYPGRQWKDRFDLCAAELPKHYFQILEAMEVHGFTTRERLSFEEAGRCEKERAKPYLPGTPWGRPWEYGWFFAEWVIPEELSGKHLVLLPGMGEEMLVWVDGAEAGAVDKIHKTVMLTKNAKAGQRIKIAAECYAGHGPRMEDGGYCQEGQLPFEVTDAPQQVIRPCMTAVWQEDIFQASMDYLTLYSLLPRLPVRSLRAMKVTQGLKRFVTTVDLELEEELLAGSVKRAAAHLRPLLDAVNGSTAPEFTIFGQSHLDLAWLWTTEETRRKAARTYSNQLSLMESYPEYRFLLCEPPVLEYLKESYPNVWERVKERVRAGQIIPEGAVYVECDTNMPCGESLVRQFLYGKEWFLRELGRDCRLAWMPDTFGFSGALPQIMIQCGVPYFSSQKMIRQDPECEPFPYNDFWWQGIDGSRVLAHFYKENNASFSPGDMVRRWEDDRIQCEDMEGMIYPFGYGDGGGGPDRELLETVRRCRDLEGAPRTTYADPVTYFEKLEERGTENVFAGELYLAWHRGVYTAQAGTKKGVRRAEAMLKEAEYWNTVYTLRREEKSGPKTPDTHKKRDGMASHNRLKELWKRLLFQEFHDILPGTGIARVHGEACEELDKIYAEGKELLERALNGLGIAADGAPEPCRRAPKASEEPYILESGRLYAQLDSCGRILRLSLDGEEFVRESRPMNVLRLYRNINGYYDAWEIGSMYEQEEDPIDMGDWKVEPTDCQGRQAFLLTGRVRSSEFTQIICLSEDGLALEFHMKIDWRERHRMLKVDFPAAVRSGWMTGEIAFGECARPSTASYQWEKDRYEVCCHRYGLLENGREGIALFNDSKYGYSAKEDRISLTLLRAPLKPDPHADQGVQEFSYACYPFRGDRIQAQVVHRGIAFDRRCHLGEELAAGCRALMRRKALFELDSEDGSCHVAAESVKLAEDGSGRAVIRLYEACGHPQRVRLLSHLPLAGLWEADLMEGKGIRRETEDNAAALSFRAFEIKTIIMEVKS